MDIPSFKEDHISQIPALQLLMKMGYEYLTPDEAMQLRGNKTTNVLLEDILRKQLKEINSIRVRSSKEARFTDANIENGINVLKELPTNEGYMVAGEYAYYLLTLGKALEQNIDGDKKSFTLQYIDWHNPANNVFHVTEEFSVMRSGSREHYRPDIVLFINGIPVCIIECKRPDIKTPIARAISQHLRSQQDDGIRILYVYSQIVLSIATDFASYGTNGTPEKFWSIWEEKFKTEEELHKYYDTLNDLKNSHLLPEQKDKLFSGRFRYVRKHFDDLESSPVTYTKQDTYLFSLCEPYRLLDMTFNYIIFENGEKKIARYQQFYAIKKSIEILREGEEKEV
jgi:type I restriction enzyme R subunit